VDKRNTATGSVHDDQVNAMIANEETNDHGKRTGGLSLQIAGCFSILEAKERESTHT
jgi:hypothetical protein